MAKFQQDLLDAFQALQADQLPGGFNPNLCGLILKARGYGLEDLEIERLLQSHTPTRAGDRSKDIRRALENANRPEPTVTRAQHRTRAKVILKTDPVELPPPMPDPTETFLNALFRPDDPVLIAPGKWNPQKQKTEPDHIRRAIQTCAQWIEEFKKNKGPTGKWPQSKQYGCFVIPNPCRGAKISDILRPENFLFEMDAGSLEAQLAVIHKMDFPFRTMVDSGGKSIHVIVPTEATTADELKVTAKRVYKLAECYEVAGEQVQLDIGNCSANRYTRLPGAQRGDRMQALLSVSESDQTAEKWLQQAEVQPHEPARSGLDYIRLEINHEDTLLGNRYLCRGGSMLFVGPSGIGKSSASWQQDLAWACGREAFGIRPARPLKVLTFQAENDDGDQSEMARGVAHGLRLTESELRMVDENTRYLTRFETGKDFLSMLGCEVADFRPDLVRLDPLNAYLGDDPKDPKAIAAFCRTGLNPILYESGCGCVVAHHTPKLNFRDSSGWGALEFSYAGLGAADLTNWARAVLVVEPVNLELGLFRFIAAKRGGRIGWHGIDGERVTERFYAYSREPGIIFWRDADSGEVIDARLANPKADRVPDDLLRYVPEAPATVGKASLIEAARAGLEIGEKRAAHLLKVLLESGSLHEHKIKRSGKRDAIEIGRQVQPEQTELEMPDTVSCRQLPITVADNEDNVNSVSCTPPMYIGGACNDNGCGQQKEELPITASTDPC